MPTVMSARSSLRVARANLPYPALGPNIAIHFLALGRYIITIFESGRVLSSVNQQSLAVKAEMSVEVISCEFVIKKEC
jgi:hypothetical protein